MSTETDPATHLDAPCPHPPHAVTWNFKYPHDGTVAIIDGMLHGTCDLCGIHVVREVTS